MRQDGLSGAHRHKDIRMIGAGLVAKIAAKPLLKGAGAFLGRVPRWVWYGLAALLLAFVLWRWIDGKIDAAYAKGFKEGEGKAYARVEAKSKKLAAQATAISLNVRKVTDAKIVRSDAHARDLLVRGPGKAAYSCPAVAAPGGRLPLDGRADAEVDRLPGAERSQLAVVPFADLVERARVCDANRLEVEAWRLDHAKRSELK
jgi:hypothetical protein